MLSAVGIMSSYVSGYTEYFNMEFNDLFNLKNLPNGHAWLYAYVSNDVYPKHTAFLLIKV